MKLLFKIRTEVRSGEKKSKNSKQQNSVCSVAWRHVERIGTHFCLSFPYASHFQAACVVKEPENHPIKSHKIATEPQRMKKRNPEPRAG